MNKKPSFRSLILLVLMTFCSHMFAQDVLKNMISLNADDLIPAVFSSNSSEYNLNYRRAVSENNHLRFGLKYFLENDNQFTIGAKPGVDFKLKSSSGKWSFFYGIDLAFDYIDNYQSERKYIDSSFVPFFRIELLLGKHFSISTEPGLFFKFQKIKDYDGSPIDNSDEIFSSGIKNLGVINLNFSF
tara:strand:+ start:1829 stop:2386 length:558 start_codon:yes stop_codon:yes gene_type:complete